MSSLGRTIPSLVMPTREHLDMWLCRELARVLRLLLEAEVTDYLGRSRHGRVNGDPANRGFRNGFGRPQTLTFACGRVMVQAPKIRGAGAPYRSRILPLVTRRCGAPGLQIPEVFLRAVAVGDFDLALGSLIGEEELLSRQTLTRLKARWNADLELWRRQPLDHPRIALAWADVLTVKTGLGEDTDALMVVIGERDDRRTEVLALVPGFRESNRAWLALQYELTDRGLAEPLLLAANGGTALLTSPEMKMPKVLHQLSWFHKLTRILELLPKRELPHARSMLALIPAACSRQEAEQRKAAFAEQFRDSCPQAMEALERDWEHMLAIYDIQKP
jgi:transposase-like protein